MTTKMVNQLLNPSADQIIECHLEIDKLRKKLARTPVRNIEDVMAVHEELKIANEQLSILTAKVV